MTIVELQEIAKAHGTTHARFCLENEASQVGYGALADVFVEMDRLEFETRAVDAFDVTSLGDLFRCG